MSFVTVSEAAKILGLDRDTVYQRIDRGDLPSITVGFRSTWIPRQAVLELRRRRAGK